MCFSELTLRANDMWIRHVVDAFLFRGPFHARQHATISIMTLITRTASH